MTSSSLLLCASSPRVHELKDLLAEALASPGQPFRVPHCHVHALSDPQSHRRAHGPPPGRPRGPGHRGPPFAQALQPGGPPLSKEFLRDAAPAQHLLHAGQRGHLQGLGHLLGHRLRRPAHRVHRHPIHLQPPSRAPRQGPPPSTGRASATARSHHRGRRYPRDLGPQPPRDRRLGKDHARGHRAPRAERRPFLRGASHRARGSPA